MNIANYIESINFSKIDLYQGNARSLNQKACYIVLAPFQTGKSTWIKQSILKDEARLQYQKIWYLDFNNIGDHSFLSICQDFRTALLSGMSQLIILDHLSAIAVFQQSFYLHLIKEIKAHLSQGNLDFIFVLESHELNLFQEYFNPNQLQPFLIDFREPDDGELENYFKKKIGFFHGYSFDLKKFTGNQRKWIKTEWLTKYIIYTQTENYWSNDRFLKVIEGVDFEALFIKVLNKLWWEFDEKQQFELLFLIWILQKQGTPNKYSITNLNKELKPLVYKLAQAPYLLFKLCDNQSSFSLNFQKELANFLPLKTWMRKENNCHQQYIILSDKEAQWKSQDLIFLEDHQQWFKHKPWFSCHDLDYAVFYKRWKKEKQLLEYQKSKKEARTLLIKKRKQLIYISGVLGFLSILSFYLFSLQQNKWIEEANQLTEVALKESKSNEEKALFNEQKALQEIEKTNQALLLAELAKKEAVFQEEKAVLNARRAQKEKKIALSQKERALQAEKEVSLAKTKMEEKALLEWSKSLALQSLSAQAPGERILRSVAAYNIRQQITPNLWDNSVYNALYQTLRLKEGSAFNKSFLKDNGCKIWSFNEHLFVLNNNGVIHQWMDVSHGLLKSKSIQLPPLGIYKNAYLVPNTSKVLAYGAFGYTVIFDLSSFQFERFSLENESYDMVFPLNEKYWIGGVRNKMNLLDQGRIIKSYHIEGALISIVEVHQRVILFTNKGNIYQLKDFELTKLKGLNKFISSVFKKSEKEIFLGDESGHIYRYHLSLQKIVKSWKAHDSRITAIQFIDEAFFVTTSLDHSWKLWNEETGGEILGVNDVGDWIIDVCYLPNTKELYVLDKQRCISQWPLQLNKWAERVKAYHKEIQRDSTYQAKQILGSEYPKLLPYL